MTKKKKKILVVLGGNSKERAVSLDSGKACFNAIKRLGYKAETFDPSKNFLNEIDRSKFNIIFNALHGKDGEDGNAQSYFEHLRIPYTHSGVISSMCAMDKVTSKEIFRKNKILIPKSHTLNCKSFKKKNLKKVIKNLKISYPIVIKPSDEGSSIGVKICKNYKKLKSAYNSLKII